VSAREAARLRVSIDARALQAGFREHAGRGIGRYAVELVAALARRDDLALTLWFEPALALPEAIPAGAAVRRYARMPLPMRDRLAALTTVALAAHASGDDVVHFLAHGDAPPLLPPRAVVTVHDLILELMGERYGTSHTPGYRVARACEASTMRSARTLVTDSAVTRDDVVRLHGVDPARVHVVHLGVDAAFRVPDPAAVAALRTRLGLAAPFVLYVGGIDERKNVTMLVDAFAHARALGLPPGTRLAFAGRMDDAPEWPALRERVRARGLDDAFAPLGFVAGAELPVLFGAADLFAFPSLYEGFGLPPLEAMACGTPVVSTTGGSLGEVIGDAARTAPADDPRAFGEAIAAVMGDDATRATLRSRGLAHAARFTWDRTAEATVAAYRIAAKAGRA